MNTRKTSISYHDFSHSAIADMLMDSIAVVRADAIASGHQLRGDFPSREAFTAPLSDSSHSVNKRLLKWHFRLKRKLSLRSSNQFLHFICVRWLKYGHDQKLPQVDYSEKETAIKAARAAWVKARDEAEALRLAYVEEKGDYYKR